MRLIIFSFYCLDMNIVRDAPQIRVPRACGRSLRFPRIEMVELTRMFVSEYSGSVLANLFHIRRSQFFDKEKYIPPCNMVREPRCLFALRHKSTLEFAIEDPLPEHRANGCSVQCGRIARLQIGST